MNRKEKIKFLEDLMNGKAKLPKEEDNVLVYALKQKENDPDSFYLKLCDDYIKHNNGKERVITIDDLNKMEFNPSDFIHIHMPMVNHDIKKIFSTKNGEILFGWDYETGHPIPWWDYPELQKKYEKQDK